MGRNLKVFGASVLFLVLVSCFVKSEYVMYLVSGIAAVLAFFGAATVCLVGAPVCIPAISVGVVVFLTGVGLSVQSAVVLVSVAAIVLSLGAYVAVIRYRRNSVQNQKTDVGE